MITVVAFSKNRAAQLDLLLSSFKFYFKEWNRLNVKVIYKATDDLFEKGYQKTISKHPEFTFIKERNFKDDVCGCHFMTPYTMFLVDDNIFINPVSIQDPQFKLFENNKNITCLSLRMNPRVNTCYTQRQRTVKIPTVNKDFTWNWRQIAQEDSISGYPSDWGYPLSVDGHVFRTADIINYIFSLNYNSPNMFEGHLWNKPINGDLMVCYENSIIFNNPVNKVQTVNGNEAGISINISAESINNKFINGGTLDFKPYNNIIIKAPHQEEPLYFI
jgi:hypothetical protein